MADTVQVDDILRELVSLVRDSARPVAIYTAAIGGLTAAGVVAGLTEVDLVGFSSGFFFSPSTPLAQSLFDLATSIFGILAYYFLLREYLAARGRLDGGGHFWAYVGMSIVAGLAVVLGLTFLLVPGVFLLVRWSASSGFLLGAGEGAIGSLGASWEATKGHGWAIFLAGLVLFILWLVVAAAIGGVLGSISATVGGLISAFLEALGAAIFAAFGIAVYCRVHDNAEEIGEVFA